LNRVSGLCEDAQIESIVTDRGRHGEGFFGQKTPKICPSM